MLDTNKSYRGKIKLSFLAISASPQALNGKKSKKEVLYDLHKFIQTRGYFLLA